MQRKKDSFLYRNGLSIVVLTFMIIAITGQFFTGWDEKNNELKKEHKPGLRIVLLSIWLREKGSPESKPVDAPHSETA